MAEPDRAAEAFAQRFARAYLSFDSRDSDKRLSELAAFTGGSGTTASAGFTPPQKGSRTALSTVIEQDAPTDRDRRVYVVGVQTDSDGLLHLAVTVVRRDDGSIAIEGFPALVGGPYTSPQVDDSHGVDIADENLRMVLRRTLLNYLGHHTDNLTADLTQDAQISLPDLQLRLKDLQQVYWTSPDSSVRATVVAKTTDGAEMTLSYELDVVQTADRWMVSAIQTIPTS